MYFQACGTRLAPMTTPLRELKMNITETTRHAIAIAEAYCQRQTGFSDGAGLTFEVKPQEELLSEWRLAHRGFPVHYRAMEVVIKRNGEAQIVLKITLVRPPSSYIWQSAMIECYIVGWVSGSHQYSARYVERQWKLHEVVRFATAEPCGHFKFEYHWLESRTSYGA